MKKQILLSTLAVLAIFSISAFSVNASTGQAAVPIWTDCRGAHAHGNIEIGGSIGQNTVVVTWTTPGSDWISDSGCNVFALTQSEMTVYVSTSGYTPVPTTVVCHSTYCSDGFALLIHYCAIPTKYGCSEWLNKPYSLRYNDRVVAEAVSTYGGWENHFGTYTLAVTD